MYVLNFVGKKQNKNKIKIRGLAGQKFSCISKTFIHRDTLGHNSQEIIVFIFIKN